MKKSRERAAGGKEGLSKSRAATNSTDIFALSRRSALGVAVCLCTSVVPKVKSNVCKALLQLGGWKTHVVTIIFPSLSPSTPN